MRGLLAAMLIFAPAATVHAQLVDVTQTEPNVPGGTIGKSLQQQIRAGRGDEFTPGSSLYLIARDPARAIRRGRQLFQRKFTMQQGQRPRVDFRTETSWRNPHSAPTWPTAAVSGNFSSRPFEIARDIRRKPARSAVRFEQMPAQAVRVTDKEHSRARRRFA